MDVHNRGILTALTACVVFSCLLALKMIFSIYIRGHAYWVLCEAPDKEGNSDSESESGGVTTPEVRPVKPANRNASGLNRMELQG